MQPRLSILILATCFLITGCPAPQAPVDDAAPPTQDQDAEQSTPDVSPAGASAVAVAPPYDSGERGPIYVGQKQTFSLVGVPAAESDVTLHFWASGDFGSSDERVTVRLNGQVVGEILQLATDCADPADEAEIVVAATTFNTLIGGGGLMSIEMTPSSAVSNACGGESFIRVRVDYCGGADCNNNGVADNCDIRDGTSTDENNNRVPDECEFVINSVEPDRGPLTGGTIVTIRGTGFGPATAVRFGERASADVRVFNETLLTATVPPADAAGPVDVFVESVIDLGHLTVRVDDGFDYFIAPPDDGTDSDGDGRTDVQEVLGYTVELDLFGFGPGNNNGSLVRRTVYSDPAKADTDGDGLDDFEEWNLRTDPSKVDTDEDGLTDYEEWTRWFTSPVSVDTDGDARGPDNLPPNPSLFDGQELFDAVELAKAPGDRTLRQRALSPTLDDTDGDGVGDYDEYDTPLRSPLRAELPQINFELADPVAVRLRVEYADSIGTEVEYGTEVSTSTTETNGRSDITSTTESWEVNSSIGFDGWKLVGSAGGSYGRETTESTEISSETAVEAGEAYSQSQSASRERTVTSSRGTVSLGLRARNNGQIAYTLNALSITVRQFDPRARAYRSLTALTPPDGANRFTLAPGDATSVVVLRDDDVDPGLIRSFLANPSNLLIEPTTYELLNADGTDFIFQTENTFARTALVIIDFGGGDVAKYRFATNVDRNPGGTYAGVPVGRVLSELGLPYATEVNNDGGTSDGLRRFTEIAGRAEEAFAGPAPDLGDPPYPAGDEPGPRLYRRFWVLIAARGDGALPPVDLQQDADALALHARDELRLVYVADDDRDGLNDRQEYTLGSSDSDPDSDDDQLSDFFEAEVGWEVTVQGQNAPAPYMVFSSPIVADADNDGWDDRTEYEQGTDPQIADTDDDTLIDSEDPYPLIAAKTLYVSPAGDGSDAESWATAYTSLRAAAALADQYNSDGDAANDVRQIWVARGAYSVADGVIHLPSHVAIYGGFAGTETRRADRDPDPTTNETRLVGSGTVTGLQMVNGSFVEDARLDGFVLEDGNVNGQGGALELNNASDVTLANLLLLNNRTTVDSGAVRIYYSDAINVENCVFAGNESVFEGGAAKITNAEVSFRGCTFTNNSVTPTANSFGGGGALAAYSNARLYFEDCLFRGNRVAPAASSGTTEFHGGAVYIYLNSRSRFVSCTFQDNQVIADTLDSFDSTRRAGGAIAIEGGGIHALVNSVVYRNSCPKSAAGIYLHNDLNDPQLTFRAVNCTIARNATYAFGSNYSSGAGLFSETFDEMIELRNCVLWGNTVGGDGQNTELEQIASFTRPAVSADNCCIENLGVADPGNAGDPVTFGVGNFDVDPLFQNLIGGDLRVQAGSPLIDSGNRFVDADPAVAGRQPLPDTDRGGSPRIVDGDGNGDAEVDVGAFEYQGD